MAEPAICASDLLLSVIVWSHPRIGKSLNSGRFLGRVVTNMRIVHDTSIGGEKGPGADRHYDLWSQALHFGVDVVDKATSAGDARVLLAFFQRGASGATGFPEASWQIHYDESTFPKASENKSGIAPHAR